MTGRIMSPEARVWFSQGYSVKISKGGFDIIHKSSGLTVRRTKWIGVMQFGRSQYAMHMRGKETVQ